MNQQPSALAGVRVLDLSRVLAGPWATQILGDFGADVIKVEKPGEGDDTRSWGPPFTTNPDGARGDSTYFLAANRNKRSVTIDFAGPEGAQLVRKLVPHCHVLVENFKTGGLKKYGLDYESVAAINPAIVYCSITGFGQTGPYASRPGYDFMIQAMGGAMSLTGDPAGEPMKSGIPISDLFTGMYAVTSILAALRHAERTGRGQHIDVSLIDSQVAVLHNYASAFHATGEQPHRFGNAHPSIAPYQVFPTADGHVVLAVGNDGQFRAFCDSANAKLASDPRFATNAARIVNRIDLADAISVVMIERTTAYWVDAMERAGVPCGPINTLPQVFADPHVQARGAVETMTRANGADIRLTVNPIRMSETSPQPRLAPPLLGQDTDDVLTSILGADETELCRLREQGVI